MRRKITAFLTIALLVCALMVSGAAAAGEETLPAVRCNGYIVQFPDAQPYIDENGRTMMPVRFITEQLGAEVSWDGSSKTARISKNNVTVEVTIGNQSLLVTKDGELRTVEMDTAAVLRDGRTYVPVRFVAEALGAYVDYSDVYKVVGIYNDALTSEQIAELRAYPYTQSDSAIGYERTKERKTPEQLVSNYGSDRESFFGENGFANSREHLYDCIGRQNKYPFEAIDTILLNATNDEFFMTLVREAAAEIGYSSENLELQFLSDGSCMYQEDHYDMLTVTVRGIILMTCHSKPTDLNGAEAAKVCAECGFNRMIQGVTMAMPVDVHMNSIPDYCVNINTIVPLAEQYEWEEK